MSFYSDFDRIETEREATENLAYVESHWYLGERDPDLDEDRDDDLEEC